MRVPVALACLALLVPLLAGCIQEEDPAFDGQAAHAFAAGLVTDPDGGPRYRIPGTAGHAQAAVWLHDAMQVPGWRVAWQNFTGAQYQQEDHGAVSGYSDCSDEQETAVAELTFHNLRASWDGPGDHRVLLAAHWDSKARADRSDDPDDRDAPLLGANDGASGVGVLLQFLREVADGRIAPPSDLEVVFFDGEDGFHDCHPLAGSIIYASSDLAAGQDRMLLLDMVGDADAWFIQEGASVQADPDLVEILWDHGRDRAASNFPPLPPGRSAHCNVLDDHIPFIERGLRAVDLIDFGRGLDADGSGACRFPPYWHTTDDTLDVLDADMMGRVGDIVAATLEDPRFRETL